jgi:hypothetical protein
MGSFANRNLDIRLTPGLLQYLINIETVNRDTIAPAIALPTPSTAYLCVSPHGIQTGHGAHANDGGNDAGGTEKGAGTPLKLLKLLMSN